MLTNNSLNTGISKKWRFLMVIFSILSCLPFLIACFFAMVQRLPDLTHYFHTHYKYDLEIYQIREKSGEGYFCGDLDPRAPGVLLVLVVGALMLVLYTIFGIGKKKWIT